MYMLIHMIITKNAYKVKSWGEIIEIIVRLKQLNDIAGAETAKWDLSNSLKTLSEVVQCWPPRNAEVSSKQKSRMTSVVVVVLVVVHD